MEQPWIIILAVIVGLFVLAEVLKTVMGLALRFVVFSVMSVVVFQSQAGVALDPVNTEQLIFVATVAALAFGITTGLIYTVFRKSRAKILLLPILGFGITFGTMAVVAGPNGFEDIAEGTDKESADKRESDGNWFTTDQR